MKLKFVKGIGVVLIAAALVSCADDIDTASNDGSVSQCFKSSDVTAFDQLSQTRFVIHTQRGQVFSANLPACQGIDWVQQVALLPIRGRQICEGDQGRLLTSDPAGRQLTCSAFSFHQLSDAEVAMLPRSAQPGG